MWKSKKTGIKPVGKIVIILAVLLVLALIVGLSLPFLGNYLVAEDVPQKCDIIVVLMGSGPDRMLGAVDIYDQGYSDRIVMVRNLTRGYDVALDRGVDIPHDTDISRDVAVQLGVPEGNITILPGDVLSTKEEAIAVMEYLKDEPDIASIMLVTSKYHSGRTKKIFKRVMKSLDRKIDIISCPTEYDDFDPDKWWKSREDLKRGVLEYLKLLNFYTKERWERVG